jgi:hypothetical protein
METVPVRVARLAVLSVLACATGCGPLANDPVDSDGGGGGGSDATTSNPVSTHDSGSPGTSQDGSARAGLDSAGGGGSEGGDQPDDSGAEDGGTADSSSPATDSALPQVCSEANATWVANMGISTVGWTATSTATATTDTTAGDFAVTGAFDGNIATRWSTGKAQAGGEFFRVDLGKAQSISQVVFFDLTDIPAAYTLALSTDDVTYTTVGTGAGGTPTAICFTAQSAQYIKITQTGTSGSWFSIYEINVFP